MTTRPSHHHPAHPTVHDNAALHRWVEEHGGTTIVHLGTNGACTTLDHPDGPIRVRPGSTITLNDDGTFEVREAQ